MVVCLLKECRQTGEQTNRERVSVSGLTQNKGKGSTVIGHRVVNHKSWQGTGIRV